MSEAASLQPMPFDDPALEEQYDQERRALTEPRGGSGGALLLIATLAFFVVSQLGSERSLEHLAIVVAVLLFHELGHYAGMRSFGYRDVRMFFIPFFGAAVSGRRADVASWKEAVVLLLGPLPGIALGVALLFWNLRTPEPLKKEAAITLLLVNGFNLLPFAALDGGKLFQRVLFSRHRFLELGFLALASAALGLVGLQLHSWALAFLGFLGVGTLPRRGRVLRIVRDLRRRAMSLPADPARLGEEQGRSLFLAARESLPATLRPRAKAVALVMLEVLDAAQPAPGFFATALLLLGWLSGVALALLAGAFVAAQSAPAKWERYENPAAGFAVEYPHRAIEFRHREKTPFGELDTSIVMSSREMLHRFTVQYYDAPEPFGPRDLARWMDDRRDDLARELRARVVSESDVQEGVRELRLENGHRVWRARLLVRGTRVYTVTTSSPEAGPDGERFLRSFQLKP